MRVAEIRSTEQPWVYPLCGDAPLVVAFGRILVIVDDKGDRPSLEPSIQSTF